MARPATGRVEVEQQADGTLRFRLRFRANGKRESQMLHEARDCACGCGGGWTESNARVELNNILTRVKAGIWEPPKPAPATAKRFKEIPTFHEFASYWLQAKLEGIIGKKPISPNTHAGYKTSLRQHLLPFFGRYRLDQVDKDLCTEFKKHLIKGARELREAIAAGADLRDENHRKIVPLGSASIRGLLNLLAQIMDEAVEDELISFNHARSKRLKVHVPKPKRTFLEMDELACVEDAAAAQDPSFERFALAARETREGSTAQAVAIRLSEGKRQKQIVAELGVAPGTVHFHVRKLGAVGIGVYVGCKAVVCTLGRSGVRNGELSDIRIGSLRVHDLTNARLDIPDSKTETGIRVVEISPYLAEVLVAHIERLRKAGMDTGPQAYLFPNEKGNRMTRKRVGVIVREAAVLATEKMSELGLPPLQHITPHSLRRTYISIELLASEFDLKWVMAQVGHADSKMTLDVYNQLQQRVKREHGASFDRLICDARAQLYGDQREPPPAPPAAQTPADGGLGLRLGRRRENDPKTPQPPRPTRGQKPRVSRRKAGVRRRDSASGHQCFQSCALPAELSRRWPIFRRHRSYRAEGASAAVFPSFEIRQRVDRVPAWRVPAADPHLEVQVRRSRVAALPGLADL
jgi:integrase